MRSGVRWGQPLETFALSVVERANSALWVGGLSVPVSTRPSGTNHLIVCKQERERQYSFSSFSAVALGEWETHTNTASNYTQALTHAFEETESRSALDCISEWRREWGTGRSDASVIPVWTGLNNSPAGRPTLTKLSLKHGLPTSELCTNQTEFRNSANLSQDDSWSCTTNLHQTQKNYSILITSVLLDH